MSDRTVLTTAKMYNLLKAHDSTEGEEFMGIPITILPSIHMPAGVEMLVVSAEDARAVKASVKALAKKAADDWRRKHNV